GGGVGVGIGGGVSVGIGGGVGVGIGGVGIGGGEEGWD
ncbi:hypothetical protein Tco_0663695, partial [Tanacetum coccineum]